MKGIDSLPTGPEWKRVIISVLGDEIDRDGKLVEEELELWMRDPVECIRELMQNPTFKDSMEYVPERIYKDAEGKVRVYEEMWTGDWWWKIQVSLPNVIKKLRTHLALETACSWRNRSCMHCLIQCNKIVTIWW